MKYRSVIKLIAGAGLAAGSMSVLASGFGGGWMQDRNTGTLYYSLAPTPSQHSSASSGHRDERLNSFGGGWVQDRNTGTLYYSLAPTPSQHSSASSGHRDERLNSFGGGWVQDRNTGTLSYMRSHTVPHVSEAVGSSTHSYSTGQESSHEQL